MKEIILFRCHNQSKIALANFNKLAGICKNLVKLYDATNKVPLDDAFNVSLEDIKNAGLPLASIEDISRLFPRDYEVLKGNADSLKLWVDRMQMYFNAAHSTIMYYLENPDFDYYWVVEYDVIFNGNWDYFFKLFENDKSDFLGPDLVPFVEGHPEFRKYKFNQTYKKPLKSFGCIQRYSRQLIEAVYEELMSGNFAYFEILFPSVAYEYGMNVSDLNSGKRQVYNRTQIMGYFKNMDVVIHSAGGTNKLFHRFQ
jgi:hypothetical protein